MDTLFSCIRNERKAIQAQLRDSLHNVPHPSFSKVAKHLAKHPGKGVRSSSIALSYFACETPQTTKSSLESMRTFATAIECIHLASLVHDDIIDDADTRRNVPSVPAMLGNDQALVVGVYLYAQALDWVSRLGDPVLVQEMSHAVQRLCEGEHIQLIKRHQIFDDLDAYLHMIEGKTAALFASGLKMGAYLASASQALQDAMYSYGLALGNIFQMTDDLLDTYGKKADLGKKIGQDLMMGDIGLPIQLLCEHMGKNEVSDAIKTQNIDLIQSELERFGAEIQDKAARCIQDQVDAATAALALLSPSPYKAELDKLITELVQRYQGQSNLFIIQ